MENFSQGLGLAVENVLEDGLEHLVLHLGIVVQEAHGKRDDIADEFFEGLGGESLIKGFD